MDSVRAFAEPFTHFIVDNFLPAEMAEAAHGHFFDGTGPWIRRHHLYSRHKATRTEGLHPSVEAALRYCESPILCATMEQLTHVRPLVSDGLRFGGGQHVIYQTGLLGMHADFTHHPTSGARRAVNLLLYLNKQAAVGANCGELELWAPDMRARVVSIAPVFNRAVIFLTSPTSWHGHPDPLLIGAPRKSLAVYYYTLASETDARLVTTDYRPRPQDHYLRVRRWLARRLKG